MKKVLLFLMLLSATSVFAQDVIVKKDGTTILSKVVEIGSAEVKYKKFSNQNGPTYTITKAEIQAINYENGEKDTFTDAVVTQPQQQQQNYDFGNYSAQVAEGIAAGNRLQKEKLLASAKSWRTVGKVWYWVNFLGGIGTGLLIADNSTGYWICAGSGAVSGIIGMGICGAIANNKESAAASIASVPVLKQDFNLGNSRLSAGVNLMTDKQRNDYALGLGVSLNF